MTFGKKAIMNVNFKKYFQKLAAINETQPRSQHAGFDAELFAKNKNASEQEKNCYPQSWVSLDDCILIGNGNYDYAVQVKSIVNYTL